MASGSSDTAAAIITVIGLSVLFLVMLYGIIRLSRAWKIKLVERVVNALKRRRNNNDPFRKQYGYSWDYFIAFRVYDEDDPVSELQKNFSFRSVLNQLTMGGLEIRLFYSLQHKEVFCKIRAPLHRLERHADISDFTLQFDPVQLKAECEKGRDGLWDPIHIPETSVMTSLKPYDYIFGKYEFDSDTNRTRADLLSLYKRWPRVTPEKLAAEFGLSKTEMTDLTQNPLSRDSNVPPPSIDSNPNLSMAQIYGAPSFAVPQPTGAASPPGETISGPGNIASGKSSGRESFYAGPSALNDLTSVLSESTMFRGIDRMKLIDQIICYKGPGGCALDPARLLKDECILAYAPLHDMVELRELEAEWITFFDFPWNQPIEKVKNYFGEKIGLYFKWLGFYTTWLIPVAFLGFFIWIDIAANENDANSPSVPYFAGIMALWSALFIEFWKRNESITAMEWGMKGYEEHEAVRPQFVGEKIRSPINGRPRLYFSRIRRFFRGLLSQLVVSCLLLIVIGVIAVIFAIRLAIDDTGANIGGIDLGGIISSIMLAVEIQILNGFFAEVALKLNDYENYRTDTEYEDALIAKTFMFEFVNSFAALFYIAFVKPYIPTIDPCLPGGCMYELQVTLGTIFLTRLLLGNLTEVAFPMIQTWREEGHRNAAAHKLRDQVMREQTEQSRILRQSRDQGIAIPAELAHAVNLDTDQLTNDLNLKYEMSEIEKTYTMQVYDVMLGPFDDYAEMAVQFGYTTMFVAAFPLATVLSFVNNYVELRVDGWKLCHLCRRPEPRSTEDIGTWLVILEMISMSSIFVNSGLIAFTSTNAINYSWVDRVWLFILVACGLFAIRTFVAWLIPDEPEEVKIQLKRQEYIVDKVIDNIADEEPEELNNANFETPSFLVGHTDDDPM